MHRISSINQHPGISRAVGALLFALTVGAVVLGWAPCADAQTPSDVDTIRVVNTSVVIGDTFDVTFYLRNVDTLGGWTWRVEYDTSLIEPLTDTAGLGVNVELATCLRGTLPPPGGDVDPLDSIYTWETFSGGVPDPGVVTFVALDQTITRTGGAGTPYIDPPPASVLRPGGGNLMRMKWLSKPYATPQTTSINLEEDPQNPTSHNTVTDWRLLIFKRPVLIDGAITLFSGTDPGGNNPPTLPPPASPVTAGQGDLLTFNVTATDPDGDSLSLIAFNLPTGATFTPNNPVKGDAAVQGTFRWTPSFSQSGTFVVNFQATDSAGLTSPIRAVTIDVVEVPRDLLFTTSIHDQLPQGGVPGAIGVVIPVNFVQVQTSYGVQFDFVYDPTSFTPTQVQASDRLDGFSIYENHGEVAGRIRIVAFNLSADPIGVGTTSVLFNIIGNIPPGATPGAYEIVFENAFESVNPDPNVSGVDLATEGGFVFVDYHGDVNLDGRIDVADVVNVVGYILGDHPLTFRQFSAADVVTDALVDVFDLVEIINIIFGQPPFNNVPSGIPAVLSLAYDPYDGPSGSYVLSADLPDEVAGAQIEIRYDKSKMILGAPERVGSAAGVNLYYRSGSNGQVSAILLRNPFEEGSKIPSGNSSLLRIPVSSIAAGATPAARIDDAKLSDPNANKIEVSGISSVPRSFALQQNYPNPFNASTVITFSIESAGAASTDARLDVFNVLGQKIKTLHEGELPSQGSYSFTWDGTMDDGNNVASGVYFYRLSLGDKNETRKMVLLK